MKKPAKRPSKARPDAGAVYSQGSAAEVEQKPSGSTSTERTQASIFDEGVRILHAGDFKRAKALFEQAAIGSSPEMAHAARIHARMCEHRMNKGAPQLTSAEDHYNFAITLMNQRSLEKAEEHLLQALKMSSDADHLHYAMALCRGLRGDVEGACKHLQRAIELQPKNRQMARNDPDFVELVPHYSLARLLYPEGMPSA
jgi:tetratricopeptide (TPR) repeat protein